MLGTNSIQISQDLLLQVSDIEAFRGLWQGLERHTTSLQLLGDVADYGVKFQSVLGPLKEKPLSIDIIRLVHATQMGTAGSSAFKAAPNQLEIRGQNGLLAGMLETAEPTDVEPLLTKLCEWVNAAIEDKTLHPLLVCAVFSAVFLQIAPFENGNMRIVRFLMMLIMIKTGYAYAPYASFVPVMEQNAIALHTALKHTQDSLEAGRPDWNAWLGCFLTILQEQKDALYDRLYGKENELQNVPALSMQIMALFKEHQRLQMKEIVKLTKGRRATIKLRINELIEGGYLKRHGKARSTWYSLI